jgi:hypothetical protein
MSSGPLLALAFKTSLSLSALSDWRWQNQTPVQQIICPFLNLCCNAALSLSSLDFWASIFESVVWFPTTLQCYLTWIATLLFLDSNDDEKSLKTLTTDGRNRSIRRNLGGLRQNSWPTEHNVCKFSDLRPNCLRNGPCWAEPGNTKGGSITVPLQKHLVNVKIICYMSLSHIRLWNWAHILNIQLSSNLRMVQIS